MPSISMRYGIIVYMRIAIDTLTLSAYIKL